MTGPDVVSAPVVVVGAGIAGLSTALALEGCTLVADGPIGEGASRLAQGGIAAAIGSDDSPALHAADTLRVSSGLGDEAIAALVARAAAGRIDWLRDAGVEFDCDANGAPFLGREAGHGRQRIVHAGGDRTGAAVMRALAAAARERPDIRVLEGWRLVDLLTCGAGTRDARAAGVLLEGADGGRLAVVAPRVVLATGGIGACFDRTTNPPCAQGAGLAAGARQGVRLADLEFVQFHPTALVAAGDPRMLLTEALRGAGAVLVDDAGEPFMAAIHPDADLAPRDVVARGVAAREIAGRPVFLDATGVDRLAARFPGAVAAARTAGLDAHRQPLPVTTAAHFHMGGIATDAVGATSLPGLWACGEVAATGLHGGNRLASNSLLEGLVFGERIARAIRKGSLAAPRGPLLVPRRAGLARADAATIADPARIAGLRRLVGASLGVLRSATGLATAQARLAEWRAQSREEEDVATVAMLLVEAALARRESRGAHFRTDHPEARPGRAARSFVVPPAAPAAALVAEWCRVA